MEEYNNGDKIPQVFFAVRWRGKMDPHVDSTTKNKTETKHKKRPLHVYFSGFKQTLQGWSDTE